MMLVTVELTVLIEAVNELLRVVKLLLSDAMLVVIVVWTELFSDTRLELAVVSPLFNVDAVEKSVLMLAPWLFTMV